MAMPMLISTSLTSTSGAPGSGRATDLYCAPVGVTNGTQTVLG
jgi:hypothetical protein